MSEVVRTFSFDFSKHDAVRWSDTSGIVQARAISFSPDIVAAAARSQLPGRFADLMDVAFAAHVADRLAPRRSADEDGSGLQWRRRIAMIVPIRDVEFWSDACVRDALHQTLNFLTGDQWSVDFRAERAATWCTEVQNHFPNDQLPCDVALFSGGLDSFAGAAHLAKPHRELMLVSGVPNPRHGALQQVQVSALRRSIAPRVVHVPVKYGIELDEDATEGTQRARAFLHVTLGCVTALLAGQRKLVISENGVGAINLPLDETQIGTRNARACHPMFLLHMQALVRLVSGHAFSIVNPFVFCTKAEACSHENVLRLRASIPDTFSCDGFPVRAKGRPQCGYCTACVLRRLALETAGLHDADRAGAYMRDICNGGVRLPLATRNGVFVMEWQARRLTVCMRAKNPWPALIDVFPELDAAAESLALLLRQDIGSCQDRLIALYRNHLTEWESFSGRRVLAA
jgi:7-cyano-7-deazaguanine synthase in queuosine biosynthesis